jgi:hypothetical protein
VRAPTRRKRRRCSETRFARARQLWTRPMQGWRTRCQSTTALARAVAEAAARSLRAGGAPPSDLQLRSCPLERRQENGIKNPRQSQSERLQANASLHGAI